uniref:Uncharacterized protein n=1 Tax=Romanomermis culicivorax TaxID=13658 RepID=A0A915K2E0_ROMCU
MKRISTVWKKLIKRVSSKSTDESSSSPSSRSTASTGTPRAGSVKGFGGRKSAGGAQDAKVLQILSDFSKNRNLAEGAGGQQNTMLFLLQREMDFYNADVERRRQKLLEEAQTCVAAVVGRKKASSVRKTDDALPYVPKRIDWSEIAKVAARKAAAAPAKQPQAAAPSREKSLKEKGVAPAAETTTSQPVKTSESSAQATP